MRRLLTTWLLGLAAAGCSNGDGGAVVVRWRLIDASTGGAAAGCDVDDAPASIKVHVDQMRLLIFPAGSSTADGGAGALDCASCRFPCAPLEWTTNFEIPEGTWRFSLLASSCGVPVGNAPPPVVRSVTRGQITNLNAIGVSMPPCTLAPTACPDGGAPIVLGCSDGGT